MIRSLISGFGGDGEYWSLISPQFTTAGLDDIAYGKGLFVTASSLEYIYTSPDGINWIRREQAVYVGNNIVNTITYGNGLFVMAGQDNVTPNINMRTSPDGITWTNRTSSFCTDIVITDITYGNGLFVAVGSSGKVATSTNGTSWTQRTSSFGVNLINGVAYGNGVYVAVGGVS